MISPPGRGLTRRFQALRCRSLAALRPTRKIQARRFCTSGNPSWVRQQRRNTSWAMSWASSWLPSTYQSVLTSSSRTSLKVRSRHVPPDDGRFTPVARGRGRDRSIRGEVHDRLGFDVLVRLGAHAAGRSAHTVTLSDETRPGRIATRGEKRGMGRGGGPSPGTLPARVAEGGAEARRGAVADATRPFGAVGGGRASS